jgi:hypothetical protein
MGNAIKTQLTEIEYKDVDWDEMDQGRVQLRVFVSTVMNLRVP